MSFRKVDGKLKLFCNFIFFLAIIFLLIIALTEKLNPKKKESKLSWGQNLFQEFFKIWGKLTKNNNQDVKDYKNLDLKVNSLKKRLNRHRAMIPTFILKNWSPNWTSHWNPNWTNKRPANWTPRFKQEPKIATRLIDSK